MPLNSIIGKAHSLCMDAQILLIKVEWYSQLFCIFVLTLKRVHEAFLAFLFEARGLATGQPSNLLACDCCMFCVSRVLAAC